MRVIEGFPDKPIVNHGVGITLGKFDGIHKGHWELIKRLKFLCKGHNLKSAMYTIDQHPDNKDEVKLLMTSQKKQELVRELGLDYMISDSLNGEMWQMSPEDFFVKVLKNKYNAKLLVVGYNFMFGAGRSGNTDVLKSLGETHDVIVEVVPPVCIDDDGVSSTRIKKALLEGQVNLAEKLLGRYYCLEGEIVHGMANGRKLGFRTINTAVDKNLMLPADGAYITLTRIKDKVYKSITNIGMRPTFNNGKARSVETHIFDFDKDVYGENAEVFFLDWIREEVKFKDLDELAAQIRSDVEDTRKYFENTEGIDELIKDISKKTSEKIIC